MGDRRNMPWWNEASMAALFTTTKRATTADIQAAYEQLTVQFRIDLYVTHQTKPLLTTQP